jgi:hypothetical protein
MAVFWPPRIRLIRGCFRAFYFVLRFLSLQLAGDARFPFEKAVVAGRHWILQWEGGGMAG